MLVLSRRAQEVICIGPDIVVKVLSVKGQKVQLGLEAPSEVAIVRAECSREWRGQSKQLRPEQDDPLG